MKYKWKPIGIVKSGELQKLHLYSDPRQIDEETTIFQFVEITKKGELLFLFVDGPDTYFRNEFGEIPFDAGKHLQWQEVILNKS
jgi:hypothetical protein